LGYNNFGQVRMGNQGMVSVVGIGHIWLEINTRCKLLLKDVRQMTHMCLHLIFISTIDDEDYHSHFGNGK
jgi:hypothetical protein